jgi:hypothetical protein
MNLTLRRGKLDDAKLCGAICYEAFKTIAEAHHFTPVFPSVDVPVELLTWMLGHAGFYAVVAELGGKVVGSNFLDERNCIAGVGRITVDLSVQHNSIDSALPSKSVTSIVRGVAAPASRRKRECHAR